MTLDLDHLDKLADEGLRLATGPYTDRGVYRHATVKALITELRASRALLEEAASALRPFAESAPARDGRDDWDETSTLVIYLRQARATLSKIKGGET